MISPLFYATSRLAKIHPTAAELSQVQDYLRGLKGDQTAQHAFFAYCEEWKLAPWLYTQMQRHALLPLLSSDTQTAFQTIHDKVQAQNERRNLEATRFLQQFHELGIEAVILKGNFLLHTTYQDLGYKKMNDFDLLVHMEDWDRIQDVFFGMDYIPLGFGWGGEKQQPTKFSHTGIPFISRNYHCITGVQWGLKSPTSRYSVDLKEAWAQTEAFAFAGTPVKQLSPAYNLLHLILHMGVYKCRIRDCMDVYNLMQQYPMDEDELVDLFARSNATEKAHFTLQLTQLCSDAVSPTLLEKVRSPQGYLPRRLEKRLALIEQTGDMQEVYHDYFQDIEHVLFRFNLFPKFHQRLLFFFQLNKLIFWPRKEIVRKFSDLPEKTTWPQRLWARIKAPYYVFALIAEEIGWGITMMLFLKLFIDLLLSLKNYFGKQESYFDYLKGRGIKPKEVVNAIKGIE